MKMTLLIGFLALAVVGLASQARAGDMIPGYPRPPLGESLELRLSLHDAIEAALENNPQVRLVKERIEAARAQAATQLGALLPNLSASLNGSNQINFLGTIGLSPTRTSPFDVYNARTTLTQNLFSLSLIQRWRAARGGIEAAGLDAEASRRDTMATVALLYLEATRGAAAVKAGEANVELNEQLLTLARNRRKAGEGTIMDVIRIEVDLENEKQKLLAARNDEQRAKLNLIRSLGIPFNVRLILTDELQLPQVEIPSVEQALTVAFQKRAELKAQMQRVKVANLSLSSVVSERIPSLSANGDTGLVGNQINLTAQTHNVGLLLSIPIFDGGREGRIQENRSTVRQEIIRLKDVADQVTLEVQDSLLTLESAHKEAVVAQQGLRLALKEVELAQDRFRVGMATNLDVTEARAGLARARDNMIEAFFKVNGGRVNLARAQGTLEELR